MFLPNYKTDAAVIICPFVVGIDPGCDTNPTGDINIPVGSYNTTTKFVHYIERGVYHFRIQAPSTGYYHLKLDTFYSPTFEIVIKDSNGNYIVPPTRVGDKDFGELKFNAYSGYYITITNTSQYEYRGNIEFSLTRYDDNTEKNPKIINNNTPMSSQVNYIGDVDYYKFTNQGGVYDIYSTGYGSGNINMKSELYLCNASDCSSKTKITDNDDYNNYTPISKFISFTTFKSSKLTQKSDMGSLDFGFRINLGFGDDTYEKTYMIKVFHFNNTQKGGYTIHVNKPQEQDLPIAKLIADGVKAVVWESEIDPSGYSYLEVFNPLPKYFINNVNDGDSFLVKQIFLINPSLDLREGIQSNIDKVKSELETEMNINATVIGVSGVTGAIVIGIIIPGLVYKEITVAMIGSEFLKGISILAITYQLQKVVNYDLNQTTEILDTYKQDLKNSEIFNFKKIVEVEIRDIEIETGAYVKTWFFKGKLKNQGYNIYNAEEVPYFFANKEISFTDDTNFSISDTKYPGTFTKYFDESEISDLFSDMIN